MSLTGVLALLAAATPTPATESSPDWTLNATLEGYYQYNFNEPYDRVNLLRAYDTRANSFSIQLTTPRRLERARARS